MAVDGINSGMDSGNIIADNGAVRAKTQDQDARQQAPAKGGQAATDRVTLTHVAKLLKDVESRLVNVPVVDAQKVEKLRNELASGAFQFDAQRVADKFLAFESKLEKSGK